MQGAQSRNRDLAAKEMFARIIQRYQIREVEVGIAGQSAPRLFDESGGLVAATMIVNAIDPSAWVSMH